MDHILQILSISFENWPVGYRDVAWGNQFTHPCPTRYVVAQKLSVPPLKYNFSTTRIDFMVLVMLAFTVMMPWTGIIRYESPRNHLRSWISCCSNVKNLLDMCYRVDGYYCAAVRVRSVLSDFEICLPKCMKKGKKYEVNPMPTMRTYGGMSYSSIHCFLTSEMDGSESSYPCSEKRPPPPPSTLWLQGSSAFTGVCFREKSRVLSGNRTVYVRDQTRILRRSRLFHKGPKMTESE